MPHKTLTKNNNWFPIESSFSCWLGDRVNILESALSVKPSAKVFIFLALLDSKKEFYSYSDIANIIKEKGVISGEIPQTTLRASLLELEKILDRSNHYFRVKFIGRGRFKLENRTSNESINMNKNKRKQKKKGSPIILITEEIFDQDEVQKEIAYTIIEKATIPNKALYIREFSARMWTHYAHAAIEGKHRFDMEGNSWYSLNIKNRLSKNNAIKECISLVGLGVGEGLSEMAILKTIFSDPEITTVHYLALDSSQRFLREHIALIKETFSEEIKQGRFLCAGVLTDFLKDAKEAIQIARNEFLLTNIISNVNEFLPVNSGMLITYFGNCLGNYPFQEIEFFSSIKNSFKNRPLEVLVGVSIIGEKPDKYERSFDDFLLEMPHYLLETAKIFVSSREKDNETPEFVLSTESKNKERYPDVNPEPYNAHHGIQGDIYRFYYKLSFDLKIAESIDENCPSLKSGTSILLINIIKYNINSLINGIRNGMQFQVAYDKKNDLFLKNITKEREYTVFSAYIEV